MKEQGKRMAGSKKYILNIILAAMAVGVMLFYATCTTSCSYLTGSLLGLDLKYTGILFMAVIALLSILKKDLPILLLLSMGIGTEVFLVAFQVRNDVYCPFCLTFGAILVALFLLNLKLRRKWGVATFIILGFILVFIFFKGSVAVPTFTVTPAPDAALSFLSPV